MSSTIDNHATDENQPKIEVNVSTQMDANAHSWKVLGTFLVCGALVSLAWGLATAGLLELASTMVAAFFFQFGSLLLRNGLIVIPNKTSEDARIEQGKSAVRSIVGMFQAFLDRSSMLRLAALAGIYALLFIGARSLISLALGLFGNIWIAAAAGALLAAIICAPSLFSGWMRALKAKGGRK